jgi:hypothetical protein
MSADSTQWIGVEAKKDGFPILMRIRRLMPDPSFRVLFVVTWSYSEDHASRLPSQHFYSMIERFEKNVMDEIEQKHLGIFVASETGLGSTKYYFYTNSTEPLASALDQAIPATEKVEFASDIDNEWREYARFMELVGG